jgi:Fur family ferric uptake transcriptional regulator
MKENVKPAVRQILTHYLESNQLRRTPERYAVLDAVYDCTGRFTLEELGEQLELDNFRVSRATLYNTLNLFVALRLVVRHQAGGKTLYEACYGRESFCFQICTVCGKLTEVKMPEVAEAVANTHLKRFHRDCFALYIYGICSACLAQQTRKLRKLEKNKNNKKEHL